MQVLLPMEKHGLAHLEEKLMKHNVQTLFDKECQNEILKIQLPKFKLEKKIPLNEHLKSLGIKNMFSAEADFSGIDGSNQNELYVSVVLQKAFIEVNEEGSEAAAATVAVMRMRSAKFRGPRFIADHPFIFFIRDKITGMLLFQGRVSNPGQ